MGVTKAPAGSPAAGDEEIDEAADQAAVIDPEPSTGTDDNAASSADPSKPVGDRDAEKQPSALDKLKAKLVTTSTDDAEAADAAEAAKETPEITEEAEPEVDETPDPTTDSGETPIDDDDPLHGFTEKEVKHPSNKGMVTRIRDLALERKKLKQAVQEIEPVKQAGEFLTKFQADNGLSPEESVAALELSAAYKRADPRAIEALEAAASQLRTELGLPNPVSETPAPVEPFRGALPTEYADMVSVLGIPEADVRLMHALVMRHKTAPAAQAPRQAPVARPTPRPAAAQPTRAAIDPRLAQAANETVADYLDMQRIPRAKHAEHVQKNLWSYLKPLAPGNDPTRIAPEDRLRLVTLAQQKFVIAQAKARAAARERTPPTLQSTASVSSPGTPATAKSPLAQLRTRLVAQR